MAVREFICNICGTRQEADVTLFARETASCRNCRSTVRYRALIHYLSLALFQESLVLSDFPEDRHIRGVGMSDWDGLAIPLTGKIDYTKTYLDKEPRLDLTHLTTDQRGRYDFVLCSEVLEHVAPPIGQAFRGLIDLLRPGGSLLLTVPYQINADTIEHFPELCEYGLAQIGNSPVLVNKKRNGGFEVFDNLTFHGGVGSTLEMRIFGERDLLRNLEEVGFEQVAILGEDCPRYGIIHREQWSLPILAKKAESA